MRIAVRTILAMVVLAVMAMPVASATHAQDTPPIDVRVVITGIQAKNLNEDSITDDGEDEMIFFYTLYELDVEGRVLQHSAANTEFFFNDEERANGSEFSDLRLVVEPANRVVLVVYAVEIDTPLSDDDAANCGADGSNAVVSCLTGGDCGDLNIDLIEQCLEDLGSALVASNDDLFENAHVRLIDAATVGSELADAKIRDVGLNSAEYDIEYTIVKSATSETPTRDETRHYVYFGTLESGNDRQTWNFNLAIGETITMRAIPYSDDLDTALELRDATGAVAAENDDASNFDTLNAILTYTSRLGGDYTMQVWRGDGDTAGDYFVEVTIE